MSTLYVTEPGARLEKEYRRILVVKGDEVLLSVPTSHISEVILVGFTGATVPAMLSLLDSGVGLSLFNQVGQMRGRLRPTLSGNVALRRMQYHKTQDPDFCLNVSRALIYGKIANARTQAMRLIRKRRRKNDPQVDLMSAHMDHLTAALKNAQTAPNLDALRGQEGTAARAYFGIYRVAIQWQGDQKFSKRTRRPPRDPVNAMLSLGYTLLTQALLSAVEVVGLDPYAGVFHSEKHGRPALALDLVEEFRSLIVDSVVLSLVNKRIIRQKDFKFSPERVWLKRRGMKAFLRQFSNRLNTEVYHPLAGRALSYQKCFEIQARQLRKVIEGQVETYQPFLTK